jgi:hypothetical protein
MKFLISILLALSASAHLRTSSPTKFPTNTRSNTQSNTQSNTDSTTSIPTKSPTLSTSFPTKSPTEACYRSDIVWILDGSSSMLPIIEYETVIKPDNFKIIKDFIFNVTKNMEMGPQFTRQAFVEYAGEYYNVLNNNYLGYHFLGPRNELGDSISTNKTLFLNTVSTLQAMGGTTNTSGVLDFVRQSVFVPSNLRIQSKRVVIIATDGFPTDKYGEENAATNALTETAALNLKSEDNVILIVIRIGFSVSNTWLVDIADYIYDIATFNELYGLLEDLTSKLSCVPCSNTVSNSNIGVRYYLKNSRHNDYDHKDHNEDHNEDNHDHKDHKNRHNLRVV